MKLLWATDIHLDSTSNEARMQFVERINQSDVDAILITGDIATGTTIVDELDWLGGVLHAPCYFVLGNHDYYGASISRVRQEVALWVRTHQQTVWLDEHNLFGCQTADFLLGMGDGRRQKRAFLTDSCSIERSSVDRRTLWSRPSILQQKLQSLGSGREND